MRCYIDETQVTLKKNVPNMVSLQSL